MSERSDIPSVWALSDGAAGNARQAEALAAALGQPFECITLQPRPPWAWLSPRRLPGAAHAFGEAFHARLRAPPRLAIGCGRQAALATRLLREAGAQAVQILDPRLSLRHWDLVVAPRHDRLRGDNLIEVDGSLHPVTAAWLADARAAWAELAAFPAPRCVLLLGGPTSHVALGGDDWQAMAGTLRRWQATHGGSVFISASRRTPAWLREAARAGFGGTAQRCWLGPEDGANPYPGFLAWADCLIVTADSANQLAEACATSAPVWLAGRARPGSRIARLHAALLEAGRVRPLGDEAAAGPVKPLRQTAAVAAEVARRLGWPAPTSS